MKDFLEKFKLIYLPFLAITIGFIIVYTFLHWLLIIKLELFSIKEIFVKLWFPIALPWIPVYFFLSPKLKLLKFKDNYTVGFQFLAVFIIAIPTIIAQEYLITATGRLTPLEKISEYPKFEKTRYYTLNTFYIDKKNIGVLNTSEVSGKNNEYFNILIYVAMPILVDKKDTSKDECRYWLGKKYSKQISNHLSDSDKEIKYKEFAKETEEEFKSTDFRQFTYLEVAANSDDHDNFNEAIERNEQYDFIKPVLLTAHTDLFKNRNGKKLQWFFGVLGAGLLIWLIILSFLKFQPYRYKKSIVIKSNKIKNLKETFSYLIPTQNYYITPILINLNLLVFILMVVSGFGFISFKGRDLLEWGANYRPFVLEGQYWRLITSAFLHGGIMHLVSNMFGLYIVGLFLEPVLGKKRYLIIYLATGIFASLASIWWYQATISVGASGAIFGLYGVFISLSFLKVFSAQLNKAYLIFSAVFVGYNLIMGLFGNIDNAAHIGGLISGLIIGLLLSPRLKEEIELDNE
jgi:membrane associated rhomboid family serine protease